MLPTAHVELTWAALRALQQRDVRPFQDVDYRGMAVASVLPDLIDKPLAVFVLPDSGAALLVAHSAILHLLVWGFVLTRRSWKWIPYAVAFSAHLLADRMWGFGQTLWWPFRGWQFHQWRHVGSPEEFLNAYKEIIQNEPKLVIFELVGLLAFIGFVWQTRLWQPARLMQVLKTGRLPQTAAATTRDGAERCA
jgi:hypothetical protein